MQHRLVDSIDSTSPRCSIWTAVLNKNLNRAFVLFELTATNEISLLDPYESTLGKCCVDPLRPPRFSGPIRVFDQAVMDCIERQFEAVRNAELVKDVVQVILYGLLAYEELFADFFVVKALSDELNDFHLAVAEEWLIAPRTGFGRCRKGIEHFGGRVAIE